MFDTTVSTPCLDCTLPDCRGGRLKGCPLAGQPLNYEPPNDPTPAEILAAPVIPGPVVSLTGCWRCLYVSQCRENLLAGLPVLCEGVIRVRVGTETVEL